MSLLNDLKAAAQEKIDLLTAERSDIPSAPATVTTFIVKATSEESANDAQGATPLTSLLEWRIRAWLKHIGEEDRNEVEEIVQRSRNEMPVRDWCLLEADREGIKLDPTLVELGALPQLSFPKKPSSLIAFSQKSKAAQAQLAAIQLALYVSRGTAEAQHADLRNYYKSITYNQNDFSGALKYLRENKTALHVYELPGGAWWKFSKAP